ncbi:sirohydrochlorin chelatase [Noviherbaspirillum saxi]|uniref:Cobalamin biosynthesis protein CbiX n=1 Tax=Noviherbaspirillum saxi TaxID=2320863 RepID=A0A3A3FVB1_9BURK|nr:CbiX/SirB N-terminal domain-containing protein [Noviherbaspirillum saxi]RJF98071.1 cobalamin biosynthesis protein CbiX [Noviherbaspirillum saxi]
MSNHALVLFAHGARDPRWAEPFERLRQIVEEQKPGLVVSLAFLELMTPRLPELIAQLVQDGCTEVTVVPVFFGQGGHVLRDLPVMIDEIRHQYPLLQITVAPAVGESLDVLNAIGRYCVGMLGNG